MSASLMKFIDKITQTRDREKRKYLWLAYLQQLDDHLRSYKLSPSYRELNSVKRELQEIVDNVANLKEAHKELIGLDTSIFNGLYKSKISQEDIDQLIEDIEQLMLPSTINKSSAFLEFKQFVYSITSVEPIGIEQLYDKEGFAFIKHSEHALTKVYQYKISSYANAAKRIKVYFHPLMEFRYTLTRTYEHVKRELHKNNTLMQLNSYLIECRYKMPLEQTILPVAKGSLVQFLNKR